MNVQYYMWYFLSCTFVNSNEPTKLDLDVLRAISHVVDLDQYPCVQQWSQWVQAVPEEESKRLVFVSRKLTVLNTI